MVGAARLSQGFNDDMIIWRGWGILTVLIVVLVGGAVVAVTGPLLVGSGRYAGLALTAGLLAAAAVNWGVGRRLNGRPGRELVDAATGERVVLRRSHELFFVRMEWWSVLLVAVAVVSLLAVIFGQGPVVKG